MDDKFWLLWFVRYHNKFSYNQNHRNIKGGGNPHRGGTRALLPTPILSSYVRCVKLLILNYKLIYKMSKVVYNIY